MKIKKTLWLAVALIMALSLFGCAAPAAEEETVDTPAPEVTPEATAQPPVETQAPLFAAGVYTGTATGHNGPLTVEVEVSDDAIKSIKVTEDFETGTLSDVPKERVINDILQYQSIKVDTVAGATLTSYAIMTAVSNALDAACDDVSALKKDVPVKELDTSTKTLEADVVVVGAGIAGINAALKAKEAGANSVLLLERLPFVGGSSMLCSGVVTMGNTSIQKAAGISDSAQEFYDWAMNASGDRRDPTQTWLIASRSGETMDWMLSHGAPFSDTVSPIMGSTVSRAHLAVPNAVALTDTLAAAAVDEGVELMLETMAKELKTDGDRVCGVIAENVAGNTLDITAKQVILASGGYGANQELFYEWTPAQTGVIFAGCVGNTGEMAVNAVALGAGRVDIEVPFTTPTVQLPDRKIITSLVLSKGAIIVNGSGERFCDETRSYADTSAAVIATGEDYCIEIADDQIRAQLTKMDEYLRQDMFYIADTLEELAGMLEIPYENLQATVDAYNKGITGEGTDPFGREIVGAPLTQAPFYAAKVKPGTPMTVGGISIDGSCRVTRTDGTVIEGLLAAGEITGGYCAYGYVGGDAMGRASVLGMVAGETAAAAIK